jgi:hypothetical protein
MVVTQLCNYTAFNLRIKVTDAEETSMSAGHLKTTPTREISQESQLPD